MTDLTTTYLGLELRNPVIVSSSGLTQTLESLSQCVDSGAGAVVLKSIFEEEIVAQVSALADSTSPVAWYLEAEEYLARYGREDAVGEYLELIREAKRTLPVPVIASINCVTAGGWTEFAARVEQAGADALELNVFVLPSDPRRDAESNEQVYFELADQVPGSVSIPVALKIGPYFSALSRSLVKLSRSGIRGLVLFNRFFQIDFDIESETVVPGSVFSDPGEILVPLRWISILSGQVSCDLAATTGVHDAAGVIKQLLAGAAAVQVCSTLYKNDLSHLETILNGIRDWMERHDYRSIDDFRGRLSQNRGGNPAEYERVQFMKATAGTE